MILAVITKLSDTWTHLCRILAVSLVKRGLSVKDSSHLLPDISGIIDLIDSPALTLGLATISSNLSF